MAKFVLITLNPLALSNGDGTGLPTYLTRPTAPDVSTTFPNYKFVESLDYPTVPPAEGNKYVRELTSTEYGWVEVADEPFNAAKFEALNTLGQATAEGNTIIHVGDVWEAHPLTTTVVEGSLVTPLSFDGELLTLEFNTPRYNADYQVNVVLYGSGNENITQLVQNKTTTGFELLLTESSAAPQDIYAIINILN